MESGRFLLAVILMIAVVVVTNILLPPPPPPEPVQTPVTDTTPAPQPEAPATILPTPTPETPVLEVPETAPADTAWVEGPDWRYGISTRGGALVSAELLAYESLAEGHEGSPVQLVSSMDGLVRHTLRIGDNDLDLATLDFRPARGDIHVSAGSGPAALELRWDDEESGTGIHLDYTFRPYDYVIDVRARIAGADASAAQLLIEIGPRLAPNEADPREDERSLAFVTNSPEEGIASRALNRVREEQIVNGPLTWVALKSKYFVTAAIQAEQNAMPFGGVIAAPGMAEHEAELTVTLLPDGDGDFRYRLYVGPQEADRLSALGLQDISVFGWKFLQPVLRPLGHAITWALLQMHRALGLGYGWVLILFGFLVRIVLWPLNATAMRSQMKNMEMQPRIKELQTKYKGQPEKLQKEMLRIYKEEGYNPMGGCLPMFLPFPVLIALFFVFRSTIEFRGVSFLWLPDLSLHDPLYILPIALGLSMFVQQWLNARSMKGQQPQQMKMMMYFMPIFLTMLFLRFASGLNLYYASMNVASLPQQLQIMKERKRRMAAKA